MAREALLPEINTNPSRYVELAQTLASTAALHRDGELIGLERTFAHLHNRTLRLAPSYNEVNEVAEQCPNAGDRLAGRAAWILANANQLRVYEVHSLLWNGVESEPISPVLGQLSRTLGQEPKVTDTELRRLANYKKL